MYKTIFAAMAIATTITPAFADGLPPPPTAVYEAPQTQTCNPITMRVYFQNGETMLSKSARQTIAAAGNALSGCAIAGVKVVALSNDGRTHPEALMLASQRIEIVTTALHDRGLESADLSTHINTDAAHRQDGDTLMARRVDVTFAAYRPEIV